MEENPYKSRLNAIGWVGILLMYPIPVLLGLHFAGVEIPIEGEYPLFFLCALFAVGGALWVWSRHKKRHPEPIGCWLRNRSAEFERLASYHESGIVRAYDQDRQRAAAYHERLVRKYEQAARCPWLPVEPDPPEPTQENRPTRRLFWCGLALAWIGMAGQIVAWHLETLGHRIAAVSLEAGSAAFLLPSLYLYIRWHKARFG